MPIASHHAAEPMEPAQVLELWMRQRLPRGTSIKHVEPLGPPARASRLLETQARLIDAFGEGRVTVLATGDLALPFRCLLARRNAFDYLATEGWAAAAGQRLLSDAIRERRGPRDARTPPGRRRGILGHGIAHSRSPRIHAPPFDRIDVPPETDVAGLLAALLPHYDGLAVTSPFKKPVARAVGAEAPAVNTLVRRETQAGPRWIGFNTDVDGARSALRRLGSGCLQILGDGGATSAIREVCREAEREVTVFRHDALPREALSGRAVWTWPADLEPEGLSFGECEVGVIAYGEPARRIRDAIRRRGVTPVTLGPAWFTTQARGQRQIWEAVR